MAPKNETVLGYDSEEFFDEIKECSQFDHHQYNQSDHHCIGSNFTHRSHCCRQRSCSNCDSNHPFSDGFILDDNLNETYCDAGKSKIQCDKQRACHNCRSRMINKLVRKVENMEHAVLDTLHRAWNVIRIILSVCENFVFFQIFFRCFQGLSFSSFTRMASRQ